MANHQRIISPKLSDRGFTLVEILIVILIASTLAAASIPSLSGALDRMKADALAGEIATDMRYAQELAALTQTRHRIMFFLPAHV